MSIPGAATACYDERESGNMEEAHMLFSCPWNIWKKVVAAHSGTCARDIKLFILLQQMGAASD